MEHSESHDATPIGLVDFIENGEGIGDENDVLQNANERLVGCGEQINETLMSSIGIGMEFDSMEEVYFFYNTYAKEKGFGIRKSISAKRNTVEKYE